MEMKLKNVKRSTEKVRMVRIEVGADGKETLIDAMMPVGRGWNAGNGTFDWLNMPDCGWMTWETYSDKKRHDDAQKAMLAENADLKARLAAAGEEPAVDGRKTKVK